MAGLVFISTTTRTDGASPATAPPHATPIIPPRPIAPLLLDAANSHPGTTNGEDTNTPRYGVPDTFLIKKSTKLAAKIAKETSERDSLLYKFGKATNAGVNLWTGEQDLEAAIRAYRSGKTAEGSLGIAVSVANVGSGGVTLTDAIAPGLLNEGVIDWAGKIGPFAMAGGMLYSLTVAPPGDRERIAGRMLVTFTTSKLVNIGSKALIAGTVETGTEAAVGTGVAVGAGEVVAGGALATGATAAAGVVLPFVAGWAFEQDYKLSELQNKHNAKMTGITPDTDAHSHLQDIAQEYYRTAQLARLANLSFIEKGKDGKMDLENDRNLAIIRSVGFTDKERDALELLPLSEQKKRLQAAGKSLQQDADFAKLANLRYFELGKDGKIDLESDRNLAIIRAVCLTDNDIDALELLPLPEQKKRLQAVGQLLQQSSDSKYYLMGDENFVLDKNGKVDLNNEANLKLLEKAVTHEKSTVDTNMKIAVRGQNNTTWGFGGYEQRTREIYMYEERQKILQAAREESEHLRFGARQSVEASLSPEDMRVMARLEKDNDPDKVARVRVNVFRDVNGAITDIAAAEGGLPLEGRIKDRVQDMYQSNPADNRVIRQPLKLADNGPVEKLVIWQINDPGLQQQVAEQKAKQEPASADRSPTEVVQLQALEATVKARGLCQNMQDAACSQMQVVGSGNLNRDLALIAH